MLTRPDTPFDDDGWGDVLADIRRLYMRASGGGQDIRNDAPQSVNQDNSDDGYSGDGGNPDTAGGGVPGGTVVANYVGSSKGNIYISNKPPDQTNNVLFFNQVTNKIEWTNVNNKINWPSAATSLAPYMKSSVMTIDGGLGFAVGECVIFNGGGAVPPFSRWAQSSYNNANWFHGIVTQTDGTSVEVTYFGPIAYAGTPGDLYYPSVTGTLTTSPAADYHQAYPVMVQIDSATAFVNGFSPCYNPYPLVVSGTTHYVPKE